MAILNINYQELAEKLKNFSFKQILKLSIISVIIIGLLSLNDNRLDQKEIKRIKRENLIRTSHSDKCNSP